MVGDRSPSASPAFTPQRPWSTHAGLWFLCSCSPSPVRRSFRFERRGGFYLQIWEQVIMTDGFILEPWFCISFASVPLKGRLTAASWVAESQSLIPDRTWFRSRLGRITSVEESWFTRTSFWPPHTAKSEMNPTDEKHQNLTYLTYRCPLFSFVRAGMVAVLGAHDISKKEKSQQWISVDKFIPHPNFNSKDQYDYDIMLLKVNTDERLTTACVSTLWETQK